MRVKRYPRVLVRKSEITWWVVIMHHPSQDPTDPHQVYATSATAEMAWDYVVRLTRQRGHLANTF